MEYAGLKLQLIDGVWRFVDWGLAQQWRERWLDKGFDDQRVRRRHRNLMWQEQERRQNAFMARYGLQMAGGALDIRVLLPDGHPERVDDPPALAGALVFNRRHQEAVGWFEHNLMFFHSQTRSYVLTTQPSAPALEHFQALETWCKEQGLGLRISYEDGWHYPGQCPLLVIGRPQVLV